MDLRSHKPGTSKCCFTIEGAFNSKHPKGEKGESTILLLKFGSMTVHRVRCNKKAGIAENAAHFLRRNGETLGDSGDLLIFAQPYFRDYDLSKFFRHLLKRLSSHHPLTPTANCVVDRSEEHTSELQSLRHLVC